MAFYWDLELKNHINSANYCYLRCPVYRFRSCASHFSYLSTGYVMNEVILLLISIITESGRFSEARCQLYRVVGSLMRALTSR